LPNLAQTEFVTRSLSRDLSLGCGIVVSRVEKSKVLMDVITENDWELRLSTGSLECFKIHIWLMPLRE